MNVKPYGLFACVALLTAGPCLAHDSDHLQGMATATAGQPLAFGPDDALESGIAAASPLVTWKYYFVPAVAMVRRSSSDVSNYVSGGCIRATSDMVVSDIQIEDGASIAVVRLYYKDTDASNSVTAWLTSYDAEGGYIDHGSVSSDAATGYGNKAVTLSPPVVVSNSGRSYVLNLRQLGTSTSMQMCGARVFYSIP